MLTLSNKRLIESGIVILYHLLNQRDIRTFGLQNHKSTFSLSTCSPTYLRHHHESMLMGTEIRIIQHRISIEDTGCGIPEDKADTIFDEFVQLDEYKDGVGIGLTLSRNTVRRLGGDIMLDATYNKGARFFMTLPL